MSSKTKINSSEAPPLKRFKKIPVYVVEEHNDALQFIYSAIGGKKLPLEGTTLLHLDSHPDMLIDRKLKGNAARSGRDVLPLLQIENWILPAVAAGHFGRVVWLRPPWTNQFGDGTITFNVGDHPDTGYLRVDCTEPYYLSDALYSRTLTNKQSLKFTVAKLWNSSEGEDADFSAPKLAKSLQIGQPYVLDIDLDFFSTSNPFLHLYESIGLYDQLEQIFGFELPKERTHEEVEQVNSNREKQLNELESIFNHLEDSGDLSKYEGPRNDLFNKLQSLVELVKKEADRIGEPPDWWAIFAGGCTRDQGGLPYHISTERQITSIVKNYLEPLLKELPPPVLITVARSTNDGYCPSNQVEMIQAAVLEILKNNFDVDDPALHYLTVTTS